MITWLITFVATCFTASGAFGWDSPLRSDSRNFNWPVCQGLRHNLSPGCGGSLAMHLNADTEDRATELFRGHQDNISSCGFSTNECRVFDQAQVSIAADVLARSREIVVKAQQAALATTKSFQRCLSAPPPKNITCPSKKNAETPLSPQVECACVLGKIPDLKNLLSRMRVYRAIATSKDTAPSSPCGNKIDSGKECLAEGQRGGCTKHRPVIWSELIERGDSCLINGSPSHQLEWIERNFGTDVATMAPLSAREWESAKAIYRAHKPQKPASEAVGKRARVRASPRAAGLTELKALAQAEYERLLIDFPVLNYLEGPDPKPNELAAAFSRVEKNLTKEISQRRDDGEGKDLGNYLRYEAAIQQAISEVAKSDPESAGDYCEVVNRMYRENDGWKTASQVGLVGLGLVSLGAGSVISLSAAALIGVSSEAYLASESISEFNTQAAACRAGGSSTHGALCSQERFRDARDSLYTPVDGVLGAVGVIGDVGALANRVRRTLASPAELDRLAALPPEKLTSREVKVLVENGEMVGRTTAAELKDLEIVHGTSSGHVPSVMRGPDAKKSGGLGGGGLYVVTTGDVGVAESYAQQSATLGKLNGQPQQQHSPVLMRGRLNPDKDLRVATIEVTRDDWRVDLRKGILPADWADRYPHLRKYLAENFDVVEVRSAMKNEFAIDSDRYFVIGERAGADAIIWDKVEPFVAPKPPEVLPVRMDRVTQAANSFEMNQTPSTRFLGELNAAEKVFYAEKVLSSKLSPQQKEALRMSVDQGGVLNQATERRLLGAGLSTEELSTLQKAGLLRGP